MMSNYRCELKYNLTDNDFYVIEHRLDSIIKRDIHTINGMYTISSIYFDTYDKVSYNQVLNGYSERWKYRIRFYNYDSSVILLEKKYKTNNLTDKQSTRISIDTFNDILNGKTNISKNNDKLLNEFYVKMDTEYLRPCIFIEYDRIPYVYDIGNVRITLDYNIHYNYNYNDVFNKDKNFIYLNNKILEVKYSDIIPDFIRYRLELNQLEQTSFSKFKNCLERNLGE